jgi:tetratricopeptide (TPR) repeat protein
MRHYPDTDEEIPRSWLGLKEAGKREYERANFAEALNLYRTALRTEYECVVTADRQVILSNIVACRIQLGGAAQAAAAVQDAKQCIDLNPNWPKGHVRLGSAYSALGQSNDACNSLQTALRLDSGNQMARQMLLRELRRERTRPAENLTPPFDGDTHGPPPPPHNPDYTPPRHSASRGVPENDAVDDGWTLRDRLQFYRAEVIDWYRSQSEQVRSLTKVAIVFLTIYLAFGGRFGFEHGGQSRTPRGPSMQGNYGEGNAYEQYYQRRYASDRHESPYRNSNTHSSQDYSYNNRRGSATSYGSSGSLWDGSLPSIAIIGGLLYVCHINGVNPFHALMVMNVMGGRRRGMFGGGGYYGGGFGRRRRQGAFFR